MQKLDKIRHLCGSLFIGYGVVVLGIVAMHFYMSGFMLDVMEDGILVLVVYLIAAVVVIYGGIVIVSGQRMIKKHPAANTLAFPSAVLMIPFFPFGTGIGVLYFWLWYSED